MTLHYQFPDYITLDEVKILVKDNPNFIMVGKDDHHVIFNYVRSGNDTFPPVVDRDTAILRELRGLIFSDDTGKIISRRYHKFFNMGENEETINTFDISKPHTILNKLDGSMVTPLRMPNSGHNRWATKMGITDVSMNVEVFIVQHPEYQKFADLCYWTDITPIFEWCSRKNRIVLDYPVDQLVLTGLRFINNGQYVPYKEMVDVATKNGIPVVGEVVKSNDFNKFVEDLKSAEDIEGVVIRFDDGHMVKIKADHYVMIHRAKSLTENERDVIETILNDKLDDLLPLFPENEKENLSKYQDQLWNDLYGFLINTNTIIMGIEATETSRKDFALGNLASPSQRSLIFSNWSNQINIEIVVEWVKRHLGSAKSFEKISDIVKVRWKEVKYD